MGFLRDHVGPVQQLFGRRLGPGTELPLVDARGPELDQGAAMRLLAEMAWYPTSLFDAQAVSWSAIETDHARASLRVGNREVSGVFRSGPDGLPLGMTGERFFERSGLQPWGGVYRDWRDVSGMRVPFEAEVSWKLEAGPFTYAHTYALPWTTYFGCWLASTSRRSRSR